MDAVFQQFRRQEGRYRLGRDLLLKLTAGRFWAMIAGCFTIYRGQDGDIDYDNIIAIMAIDDSEVAIAHQDLPANSIWHFVRRQVSDCGKESPDGTPVCIVQIDDDGDAYSAAPNAPVNLEAEQIASGKIRLRWRYSSISQAVAPSGFRIYIDSGSGFNFDSPDDTVAAPGILSRATAGMAFSWTSEELTDGQLYKFCVRSYKTDGGESQNNNYVAEYADATGPDAITDLRSSWEEA